VLLSGVLAFPAYAEKVQMEQLPSDLQEKIRAQTGGNRVEDIDRTSKDGRTVYEVAFKEDGQHREVQIEHSAAPAPATPAAASSAATSGKIRYSDVPENVRRVADRYIDDAEVNDVDRQVKNGRTTYEIGYKRRDGGPQREVLIGEDGQILSESRTPGSATNPGNRPGGDRVRGNGRNDADANYNRDNDRNYVRDRAERERNRNTANDRVNWGNRSSATANSRSMAWADLPAPVKRTSNSLLKKGDVKHVHRIIQNGNVTYQLDFEREDGKWQQLIVAEDGRAIRDQIVPASSVGAPASVQSGSSSSTVPAQGSNVAAIPVALSSAQPISRSQLPNAVAQAMRGYTTGGNIVQIQRGTSNGREIYDVTYRETNNQVVQVQFDQSGSVVYDPRQTGAASTQTPTQGLLNNIGRLLDNNN